MTLPLVSILISVTNNEDRIERVVRSSFNESYFNHTFEVIALDDGSNDDTHDILIELEDEYPDLVVLHNDKEIGQLAAKKELFDASRGEYIFYLCGDCFAMRKTLWRTTEWIEKLHADMLTTAYIPSIVGMRQPRIGVSDLPEWYGLTSGSEFIEKAAKQHRGCYNMYGKLIRREVLQKAFEEFPEYFDASEKEFEIVNERSGEIFVSLLAKANPKMQIAAEDIETTVVTIPKKDDDLSEFTKNKRDQKKFEEEVLGRQILKQILTPSEYYAFDSDAEFNVKPSGDIKCNDLVQELKKLKELFTKNGFAEIADSWLGWFMESHLKRCSNELWQLVDNKSEEKNKKGNLLIFDQGKIGYNPRWIIETLGADNLFLIEKDNGEYKEFKNTKKLDEHDAMKDCYNLQGEYLLAGGENIQGLKMSIFFWMEDIPYWWYV